MIDPNIFREYDIRGMVGPQLTRDTVALLARAMGTYFRRNGASKIAIGFDARQSSPEFCELLRQGIEACGCDSVLIGMVPTPVLYHTVFTRGVDGGVMITGSHNPADHNGFKICLGTSTLHGGQIQEIRKILEAGVFETGSGSSSEITVIEEYQRDLVSRMRLGSRKIKAVVDAGNGVGSITAVPIYESLGVKLTSLFGDPDPAFPNHHPDPTVEENLQDLIRVVRKTKSDVGIAFDGDADRIGVVDETGRIMWGDELMVLYSRDVLAAMPGATVIAEVKCSQNLFDDIELHGGRALMSPAGHSIIKAKMKETGSVLAGEMSGHMFFADRYYGFDDAAYAGARLIEILSKTEQPLSELLADLPKSFSTPELRMPCSDEAKFELVSRVAEYFSRDHQVITIDGARVIFDHGWGLVRASNTQPMLVLRFEADAAEELAKIRDEMETAVRRHS